ncbi:MAG: Smr/MutS family protein [Halobacteriovoraceae bacterium]|nr:Smr/MutS family protein [Halobacteriovoraceae bacterium]
MPEYDLHGYKLDEAIRFVESIIGKVRLEGKEEVVKIITGRGIIRSALVNYFKKNQIQFDFELGNDGALVVEID